MRVLTILNSASMGGVEKTLLSCLKNMKGENIKMTILCFRSGGQLEDDFKKLGVNFLYIKKTGLIVLDMIQLFLILLKHRFDVVHSRFGFTSGGFVLGARLAGARVYVSLHNTDPSTFKTFNDRKILYRILALHLKVHKWITKKFATKIIGHSKSNLTVNYPNWEGNSNFELMYNGVDFEELENDKSINDALNDFIKREDFVILHIGSFREQKNHSFLIDCFNAASPKLNNYKLILVGTGGLLDVIKKKVCDLGLSENVFFAGFDKGVNKYFDKSDLFFFPSLNEGLANVIIEAQYKRIPICVADIPPLYESGYNGYHKYYFSPREEKAAIQSLIRIITDIKRGDLESTKREAKKYAVGTFSIQSMVSRLVKLYNEK